MHYPSIVVLFTNYRCNARCVMCSAWHKHDNHKELSLQNIERIFSDKVLSRSIRIINITGGEPTLREDLVDIVKILASKCHCLERIDISTNGINTVMAIDKIEQILAFLLQTRIKLTVSVSVDGVEDVHDRVRGVRGAFKNIDKTIEEIKEFLFLYPGFYAGINTTISRFNYDNLEDVLEYSRKKTLGVNFTLAAISDIGVESLAAKDVFKLEDAQKETVKAFIRHLLANRQINQKYGKFLLHWLDTGVRIGRCAFKEGMSVLCEPDGLVYRCGNFKDFKMGNLLQSQFGQILDTMNNRFANAYNIRCKTCNSNCYIDVTH